MKKFKCYKIILKLQKNVSYMKILHCVGKNRRQNKYTKNHLTMYFKNVKCVYKNVPNVYIKCKMFMGKLDINKYVKRSCIFC